MRQDRRACAIRRPGQPGIRRAAGQGGQGGSSEHGSRERLAQESLDLRRFRCRLPGWVTARAGWVRARGHACGMSTLAFGVS